MPAQRIAFIGATGDSAGFCLAAALKAGHRCIALARTPAKLTQSMQNKGVSQTTLDNQLTIIPGDVRDPEAIKATLQLEGQIVDTIVSGIGAYPMFQWSVTQPFVSKDPALCRDACRAVFAALEDLQRTLPPKTEKPSYIHFSTTGIYPPGKPRDVPLLFLPLYRYFLHSPHEDKRALEVELNQHVRLPEAERRVSAFVVVRASLLLDGEGKGLQAVRAGSDSAPAVGYTIQRKDVGEWAFANLLVQPAKQEWVNGGVSITY